MLFRSRKVYGRSGRNDLRGEFGPSHSFIQKLPLDYVIGSVHFVPTRDGRFVDCDGRYETFRRRLQDYFHDDIRYVVETFFASTIEMIEAGGFDIIGHFDKIGLNASYYKPGIEQENSKFLNVAIFVVFCKGTAKSKWLKIRRAARHHDAPPSSLVLKCKKMLCKKENSYVIGSTLRHIAHATVPSGAVLSA